MKLLNLFPKLKPRTISDFLFPWPALLREVNGEERYFVINKVFKKFNMNDGDLEKDALEPFVRESLSALETITKVEVKSVEDFSSSSLSLSFALELESPSTSNQLSTVKDAITQLTCRRGTLQRRETNLNPLSHSFYLTSSSHKALSEMLLLHALDFDFCIIGEKGGGKTRLVNHFAHLLGFQTEHVPLYKDVSSRQLLQRRATLDNGDTIWEDSPLVVSDCVHFNSG